MTIATEIVEGIAVISPQGSFTIDEANSCLKTLFRKHKIKHTMWDLTNATLSDFRATEFLEISKYASRFSPRRGAGARAALVSERKYDRMLLEAFTVFAKESTDRDLGIFDCREDAFAWLNG